MTTVRQRGGVIASAVLLVLALRATVRAGDVVLVGNHPASVYERRSIDSRVLGTVQPGTALPVFDRADDWVWVLLPPDESGARRVGWIERRVLAGTGAGSEAAVERPAAQGPGPAGPVLEAGASVASAAAGEPSLRDPQPPPAADGSAERGNSAAVDERPPRTLVEAAESAKRASKRAEKGRPAGPSSGGPPAPVGSTESRQGTGVGDWIVPRALRASVGFNYQSANTRQAAGSLSDQLIAGGSTVVTSLAVLDPRILSVDFAGDFQASRTTSRADLASFRDASGLQSYRLDLGVLSGRRAPLRLYADRLSSTSDMQPLGATLDPLRRTRGVRRGAGFTWDLDPDPALPHVWIAASTGRQIDERDYLFGYSSINDERRAEIRANRDYKLGRYDFQFTHGAFAYAVPDAAVRSDTSSDVLLATGRLTPSSRLAIDLHARGSRFVFGTGGQTSSVRGAGADGAIRYELPGHVAASARYSFSNNAFEAALSGRLAAGQPGATPVTSASQLATRTVFQDGEGRVEYSTKPVTAAAIVKGVSFDVPASEPITLSGLRTAGAVVRAQGSSHGLTASLSADGAVGAARSNRGSTQPYHELGVEASLSRDAARVLRFGVDGSARRIGRLAFFPVNLDARTLGLRFETTRPGWARLRASVTRMDSRRDIMLSDARDQHTAYGFGLSGRWYDLSADINQTDTRSLLLSPDVFGSRPDVALLIASHPELFRNLVAASDRSRVFGVQLRPTATFQFQARVRRQEQVYPDLFGFRVNGAQAWTSYQIRDLQLELGWEYFDSLTSFGNVRDRRVYVRVRRDVVFF